MFPADALAPAPAEAEAEDSPELLDDPPDELEDEVDDPPEELEDELPDELDDESPDDEVGDDSVERMLEASSKLGGPLKENWTPVGNVPVCPFLSITPKAVSCKAHRETREKAELGLHRGDCAAVGSMLQVSEAKRCCKHTVHATACCALLKPAVLSTVCKKKKKKQEEENMQRCTECTSIIPSFQMHPVCKRSVQVHDNTFPVST